MLDCELGEKSELGQPVGHHPLWSSGLIQYPGHCPMPKADGAVGRGAREMVSWVIIQYVPDLTSVSVHRKARGFFFWKASFECAYDCFW